MELVMLFGAVVVLAGVLTFVFKDSAFTPNPLTAGVTFVVGNY